MADMCGWAASHEAFDPLVEYRTWPIATSPTRALRESSSNTWVTSPRSLETLTVSPSPTGDARAFLPPVLQCLQAKARHAGDILARCVDSKYATFLVHRRTHLPVASPKLTRGLYTSRVSPSFQAGKSISDRGSRRRESRAGAPRFRAGSRPKGLGRSMAWSRGCPRTPGSVSSFPRTAPCWSGACR